MIEPFCPFLKFEGVFTWGWFHIKSNFYSYKVAILVPSAQASTFNYNKPEGAETVQFGELWLDPLKKYLNSALE
jgi:hypothetical protein